MNAVTTATNLERALEVLAHIEAMADVAAHSKDELRWREPVMRAILSDIAWLCKATREEAGGRNG